MRKRESEREGVYVCVREKEKERDCVCLYVSEIERDRESVCVHDILRASVGWCRSAFACVDWCPPVSIDLWMADTYIHIQKRIRHTHTRIRAQAHNHTHTYSHI